MSGADRKENSSIGILARLKSNKKIQYFLLAICIIVLILICCFCMNEKNDEISSFGTTDSYVNSLENRLSSVLSKVDGAGKVSVVITVGSGNETVLATTTNTKETSSGKETEGTPIIVNGKTVVVKELYPKITGVLIVAEGANNINVMRKIQQATISLLDIKLDQIEILSMK